VLDKYEVKWCWKTCLRKYKDDVIFISEDDVPKSLCFFFFFLLKLRFISNSYNVSAQSVYEDDENELNDEEEEPLTSTSKTKQSTKKKRTNSTKTKKAEPALPPSIVAPNDWEVCFELIFKSQFFFFCFC
jgi:hypothetical protein